jgi:ABC-type sugar transport system substrate-binding protein
MTQVVAQPEFFYSALAEYPVREVKGRVPVIGFVETWSEHIWYRTIVSVMQARASQYGTTLLVEDTKNVAEQLQAIEQLLDAGIGGLVVVPAAEHGYDRAVQMAAQRKVPIIAESDPMDGAASLVAIDDFEAGRSLGCRIGHLWATQRREQPLALDVGLPGFASCRNRSDGFLSGLKEACPHAEWVSRVDGRAQVEASRERATEAFVAHSEINLVFGIDDESVYGALQAWRQLGRAESSLWAGTFGLAGDEEKRRLLESPSLHAGLLMFPEYVAVQCFDAAVAAAAGGSLPARLTVPTVAVDAGELTTYYRAVGRHWLPDFRAIASIPAEPGEVAAT